jgi:hypothetical protein
MKIIEVVVVLLLAVTPTVAYAEQIFPVAVKSAEVTTLMELGKLEVEGVGTVTLTAKRNGMQITVQAIGPGGSVAGEAESIVGLNDTPLFLKTSTGLKRLTIRWGVIAK